MNLQYDEGGHLFFDVLLHLGTLVSVFVVYRPEIRGIIKDTGNFILKRGDEGREADGRMKPGLRMLYLIIVGTIPLIVVLPFYDLVEQLYYKTVFIAFALFVTGGLLYASDKFRSGKRNERSCRIVDALIIGLAQMVAVIPGLSRSGTTITVALARGCSREFASRYSFLLSIPAVVGSFLISLVKAFKVGIIWANVPIYLIGMVVSAIVGIIAILIVRSLVSSVKFGKFAYYCWAAGLVTLILSFIF